MSEISVSMMMVKIHHIKFMMLEIQATLFSCIIITKTCIYGNSLYMRIARNNLCSFNHIRFLFKILMVRSLTLIENGKTKS